MFKASLTRSYITGRLRRFWLFPLATAALAALVVIAYLAVRTPMYEVSMVVAPATMPGQNLPKSLMGLSSAASLLTGGSLDGGDSNLERLQQLLISPVLTAKLDPNGPIFRQQYAGEWNAEQGRWEPPSGAVASTRRAISELLGGRPWQPPGPARLATDLKSALLFAPVGKSQMMRISIRTPKPQFAVELLTVLHKAADSIIREQQKRRVVAYLDYLNRSLPQVANSENRTAITGLVVEQQRQLMTLSADNVTFASEVVEPPSIPYRPIGLGPLAVLAISILVGLIAGLAGVVYLPEALLVFRRQRSQPSVLIAAARKKPG